MNPAERVAATLGKHLEVCNYKAVNDEPCDVCVWAEDLIADALTRVVISGDEWLQYGYEQGWAGPPVCQTHDGLPTSAAEDKEFEEGDPCIHVLRLYESTDIKIAVEDNHGPSVWRATNQGWTVK